MVSFSTLSKLPVERASALFAARSDIGVCDSTRSRGAEATLQKSSRNSISVCIPTCQGLTSDGIRIHEAEIGPLVSKSRSRKRMCRERERRGRRSVTLLVCASYSDEDTSSAFSNSQAGQIASGEKEKPSGNEMVKLFNDAQQNMLFLNKQRMLALEELQKVERDREFLMAKVAQLEAENHATAAQKEVMEQRLKQTEAALEKAESRGGSLFPTSLGGKASSGTGGAKRDPPSIWSSLLLRVDSLLLSKAINEGQAQALRSLVTARDIGAAEVFVEKKDAEDGQIAGALLSLLDSNKIRGLHVIHICTEFAPVVRAGSLGPWITGLCRSLRRKGHLVEVVMPKYASMDLAHVDDLREAKGEINSLFANHWHRNKIWMGTVYGIPVTFIEPLHPAKFFDRERLYGFEDDFERFTYFSRAALEYVLKVGKKPDVLHLHNWQTALAAPLFWEVYHHQGLNETRLLFTCHDFKFQNAQPAEKLSLVGLDPYQLNRPDRLQDNSDPALVNLLKGGIVYSNKVTTISPTYAMDVKVKEFGCGLDSTVSTHSAKFSGLPSGLDEAEWNPAKDLLLPVTYTAEDPGSGKSVARAELRTRLGLPVIDPSTGIEPPLVVCLNPQVSESDVDALRVVIYTCSQQQAQLVFVGASRAPKVQMLLEDLQRDIEEEGVKLVIFYEDSIAHISVAAADILVCPNLHDPLAALPLVGLKYGALPVARQAGSSSDCIVDADNQSRAAEANGFPFFSSNPNDLGSALFRAISKIKTDPESWERLVNNAMASDCSWDGKSSDAYIDAYWSIRRC